MDPSGSLFELVKSLSGSEKGYFKKYTSMHVRGQANNYSRLFDAIEAQKKYDEKKIIGKFSGEKFTSQFSVAKNYLYNLILRSLESYHSTTDSRLNSSIHRIDILFQKRLYEQAERLIVSAKQQALEYEKHLHLLALIQRELLLMSYRRYVDKDPEDVKQMFAAANVSLEATRTLFAYWNNNTRIFMHIKQKGGYVRSKKDKELFDSIINQPLMRSEKNASTFLAKYFYHVSFTGYYFSVNSYKKMHAHCIRLVKLLEDHPRLSDEIPQSRINALLNLSLSQMELKRFDEVPAVIEKMRRITHRSEHIQNLVFEQTHTVEMQYCIITGQFERALELFDYVEKKFSEAKKEVLLPFQMAVVYFHKAVVLFSLGKLRESAKLLNMGLGLSGLNYRNDLHCFAKIFSLVVHYELGNQDLLDYMIRSTYRYLLKRDRLYRFETLVIDYIRKKMPRTNSKKELMEAFRGLRKEFLTLMKDPYESNAFLSFDYVAWLDSKLENRPYAEVVKEKAYS